MMILYVFVPASIIAAIMEGLEIRAARRRYWAEQKKRNRRALECIRSGRGEPLV